MCDCGSEEHNIIKSSGLISLQKSKMTLGGGTSTQGEGGGRETPQGNVNMT